MAELQNIDKANELLQKQVSTIKQLLMPTGDSDFKDILHNQCIYVDKTLLAKEILDSGEKVILITRPRRWGKTLGMSMLKYFLSLEVDAQGKEVENNSNRALFDNLEIAKTDKINEQGKHPVIFLTLKDVKGNSYEEIENNLRQKMSEILEQYTYLYEAIKKADPYKYKASLDQFDRILKRSSDKSDITKSIALLSRLLSDYHGKTPFVLIDEYDVPLNNTYNTDYYQDTLSLIRGLFEAGIKDNNCMKKAIVTGVFKIAKSGLWTGMNNSSDYSILSKQYAQHFGFTETQVEALLDQANIQDQTIKSAVKEWYNGYNIGGFTMYNPWSIINFFSRLQIAPYWVNTESAVAGDRKLSMDIMITEQIHDGINLLISNFGKECIEITINPEVVFSILNQEANSLWGLLLFGGYLSVESFRIGGPGNRIIANAKIPNKEVLGLYEDSIVLWVREKLFIDQISFDSLGKNFNLEDIDCVRTTINKALELYGDRIAQKNENIFHSLIQSLCLFKGEKHQLASESLSGLGRIDSIFYPVAGKSNSIVIHEYKIIKDLRDEAQLKTALTNAIWQIYEKIYMDAPLLGNKYFEGLAKAVELRAIVILCNPINGKKFTCEILTRHHPIAQMKEIAKAFRSRPRDHARIAILKSEIQAEVEKYIEVYM